MRAEEQRMKQLADRVAVITGGASGIGFATAEALAREGVRLVIADIERASARRRGRAAARARPRVEGVVCDVSDRASVSGARRRVVNSNDGRRAHSCS
jgi:NAD(P)-dependent dehydrogenase (short-subunit alcohol dehydrogenase family)